MKSAAFCTLALEPNDRDAACSGDRAKRSCAAANAVKWQLLILPILTVLAPGTVASDTTESQAEWWHEFAACLAFRVGLGLGLGNRLGL